MTSQATVTSVNAGSQGTAVVACYQRAAEAATALSEVSLVQVQQGIAASAVAALVRGQQRQQVIEGPGGAGEPAAVTPARSCC